MTPLHTLLDAKITSKISVSQRTQTAQHIAQYIADLMKTCAQEQLIPKDAASPIPACQKTQNAAVQCVRFIVLKDTCSVLGEPIRMDAGSVIHAFPLMKIHPVQQHVLWPVTMVIWSAQDK